MRRGNKSYTICTSRRIETGIFAVENLGDKRAVILKHHGVTVIGKDLNEALHSAIYLEEASEAYLAARAICEPPVLRRLADKKST